MNLMKLQENAQLVALMQEHIGEDDDLTQAIAECTNFNELLERVAQEIVQAEALAQGIKSAQAALADRGKRLQTKAGKLRDAVLAALNAAQLKKIELPSATFSVGSKAASVVIIDEAQVPDEFCEVERKISKQRIKEALHSGKHVNGAQMSNGGQSLTMRVK